MEDDSESRHVATAIFELKGHRVEALFCVTEALEKAAAQDFDGAGLGHGGAVDRHKRPLGPAPSG